MISSTMHRPIFATLLLALGVHAASAQHAAPAASGGKVLVRVNDVSITLDEFNRRYEQNSKLVPGATPSKQDVLKNIIYFELATQEARRLKIHQEQALKDQFDILLYQAIIRRSVQPKVDSLEVSESEVRKYYEANPLLRTSHIILLSKPGMSEAELKDLRKRAQDILAIVRTNKKSFEEYAQQYSEGPSAKTGGDVDWGARHKLLPEFYEAALRLKNIGDVSDLVETPYGIHIIKLTGRRPYAELDAVYKDFIVRTLRESKGQEIFNAYFEGLRKKSKVTVNEDLIK
ncbi:MAG: peptidylprolyl isomerase [Bdellovibrionota bacterium]